MLSVANGDWKYRIYLADRRIEEREWIRAF